MRKEGHNESLTDICPLVTGPLKPRCLPEKGKTTLHPPSYTNYPQTHTLHCPPRKKARTSPRLHSRYYPHLVAGAPGTPGTSSSHTPEPGSQLHPSSPEAKDIGCKGSGACAYTHARAHTEMGAGVGGECSVLMKKLGCSGSRESHPSGRAGVVSASLQDSEGAPREAALLSSRLKGQGES